MSILVFIKMTSFYSWTLKCSVGFNVSLFLLNGWSRPRFQFYTHVLYGRMETDSIDVMISLHVGSMKSSALALKESLEAKG